MVNGSANYKTPWPDNQYLDTTYYTTEVGAYDTQVLGDYVSDSAYGTFDQGGNVREWNEAVVFSWARGTHGGSFCGDDVPLHASSRNNYYELSYPTLQLNNIGFRVSEVPEPATLSLLALGGLLVTRRRR